MSTGGGGYEQSRLYPSEVMTRLYLSSHALAYDPAILLNLNVTHVVNVTPDHPNAPRTDALKERPPIKYHRIPIVDDSSENIREYLTDAVAFISDAIDKGGVVLVHCRHGQSRSATVVGAWLMAKFSMTRDEALTHMKKCRPRVSPNGGFLGQLNEWASDYRQGRAASTARGADADKVLSETDRWMLRSNLDRVLQAHDGGSRCSRFPGLGSPEKKVAVLVLPGSLSPPHAYHIK
jgi:protein-tyrosine phosphatase